ncbi:hypothetical protein FGF04_01320 [Streptomyces apricus]|uniref:Uncharacterized protein n=1 Tax=Streptomyces apricus TaxID=1828112 RepID=A0A5B0BN64_9ACTN|nr:hypothetical protein FGF04_01320 [Streptomyces apricus]
MGLTRAVPRAPKHPGARGTARPATTRPHPRAGFSGARGTAQSFRGAGNCANGPHRAAAGIAGAPRAYPGATTGTPPLA